MREDKNRHKLDTPKPPSSEKNQSQPRRVQPKRYLCIVNTKTSGHRISHVVAHMYMF